MEELQRFRQFLNEKKTLRVFDFDDTLAKSTAYIYVKHKDGKETKLDPAEYATYEPKVGDEFDFRDFNKMLNNPKSSLNKAEFLEMYQEDTLGNAIPNVENWLISIFTYLCTSKK